MSENEMVGTMKPVGNGLIWGGIIACSIIGAFLGFCSLIIIVIIIIDEKQLKKAGYANVPSSWWALIPPVYFWKRANLLNHSKLYFWASIALPIVCSIITALCVQ